MVKLVKHLVMEHLTPLNSEVYQKFDPSFCSGVSIESCCSIPLFNSFGVDSNNFPERNDFLGSKIGNDACFLLRDSRRFGVRFRRFRMAA